MLHYQPRPEDVDDSRLGVVVGKKFIRSAVDRNLVKRIARERFRLGHVGLSGYDLVLRVIAKPQRLNRLEISAEILALFAKLRPRVKPTAQSNVRQ